MSVTTYKSFSLSTEDGKMKVDVDINGTIKKNTQGVLLFGFRKIQSYSGGEKAFENIIVEHTSFGMSVFQIQE